MIVVYILNLFFLHFPLIMKPITFLTILCLAGFTQSVPLNLQHNVDAPCNSGLLDCAVACVIDGYVGGVCLEESNKCQCDVPIGRDDNNPFYQQHDITKKVIVVGSGATQGPSTQQQSGTGTTSGQAGVAA
ncbi:hypothetical protein BJV82DRAFT_605881 [Fennellomyces sp. T-0311]|nr:hypothetical protein BJV82DRAFT_605881 [Fennellomyces sp. T-0311]